MKNVVGAINKFTGRMVQLDSPGVKDISFGERTVGYKINNGGISIDENTKRTIQVFYYDGEMVEYLVEDVGLIYQTEKES